MALAGKTGRAGTRREPEKTRASILRAALEEFAHEGVAGARTDEIARRAGVNKALLYYYFKDKDGLYAAAVDSVISGLHDRVMGVLRDDTLAPRERLLRYVEAHFDYIASSPGYPRVVQREFMRTPGQTLSPMATRIVERYAKPMYSELQHLLQQGVDSGAFRALDPGQTMTSILGTIVFYFISLPTQQALFGGDPTSPERIAARRAAILDFISTAVFQPERP